MYCPDCCSADVRLSYRAPSGKDVWHRLWGERAYRCRQCRKRFHARPEEYVARPVPRRAPLPRVRETFRHKMLSLAVYGVLFVVFLVFLSFLARERSPLIDRGSLAAPPAALAA